MSSDLVSIQSTTISPLLALPTDNDSTATTTATANNSLAVRVQKKVLSKLSKRGVVRLLATNRVCSLMDTMHALLTHHYAQPVADKVVKDVIKLTLKLGLLDRENVLNESQRTLMAQMEQELRHLALTIQSFCAIQYSYERAFLSASLERLHSAVRSLVSQTLREKSAQRCANVFDRLTGEAFLDAVFNAVECAPLVETLARELDQLMEGKDAQEQRKKDEQPQRSKVDSP